MTSSPGHKTSVCLLVYNHRHLIESTLRSVLDQTLTGFELIVSDDCSTDGTWEYLTDLAASDTRITLIRTPRNMGMAHNANFAVEHSTRPYIALLHHDDIYREDLLQKWAGVLDRHPEVGFVFNHYGVHNGTRVDAAEVPGEAFDGKWFLEEHLLARWGSVVRGTAMVRRTAWDEIGGMRTEYGLLADVDLWMRLSMRGPVGHVPEVLVSVRQLRPESYPDSYKTWSWMRQRHMYDIHASNRLALWDIGTLAGRLRWWAFRWNVTRETAKWLVYALVRRNRDMLASSRDSVSPYDTWPLHLLRHCIDLAANLSAGTRYAERH